MKPIKVVIIDDEEAHLELIKQAIGRELPLASVDWFEEARVCLERLDEISPDVIITDYLMDGMDGIEFLQALNRDNRDIPVIMITGYGDQNIAVQAMKLGASDYLVKIPGFHALLPSVIKKVFCEQELKKSLRRSERRFRDLAETISDWIWEVDVEGKYTYSNPAVKEILGYSPQEVVGKRFCDFFIDKKREVSQVARLQAMAEGKPIRNVDNPCVHKNGHEIILETSSVALFDNAGNLLGCRGVHRDISKRKRAEIELRRLNRDRKEIFQALGNATMVIDPEFSIMDVNRAMTGVTGKSTGQLVGTKCYTVFHGTNQPPQDCPAKEILASRRNAPVEREMKALDRTFLISCTPVFDDAGNLVKIIHACTDLTDRKRAEQHIHSLTQQLIRAQEAERKRISRELHDLLGQDLSALKIGLDTLFDDETKAPPETIDKVSRLSEMLHGTIKSVRNLSYNLRPTGLTQIGLVPTVRSCCEEFAARYGVRVDFFSAGIDELRLDSDTKIILYRVIQEGLNNIRKHADASNATIRLIASFPDIILRIEDNGRGFDVQNRLVSALDERHMGLRSMKERVALLDGKMRIESRAIQGTKILIEVPIKEEKGEQKDDRSDR